MLHALIREHRDAHKVPLNLEHRLMLAMAPDYDHLPLVNKVREKSRLERDYYVGKLNGLRAKTEHRDPSALERNEQKLGEAQRIGLDELKVYSRSGL